MRLKSLVSVSLAITSLLGCRPDICSVDYIRFERSEAPLIYIINQKDDCVYRFEGEFWFQEIQVISEGDMIFSNEAIFLLIDRINSVNIKYFDFSKKVGEKYQITFDPSNSNLTNTNAFIAQVEKIIKSVNGTEIFVFRVKDAFIPKGDYLGYTGDLVYFVTRENGVIGSYISRFEEGIEKVIHRKGNILEDVLDYSKKEFRNIN